MNRTRKDSSPNPNQAPREPLVTTLEFSATTPAAQLAAPPAAPATAVAMSRNLLRGRQMTIRGARAQRTVALVSKAKVTSVTNRLLV